MLRVIHMVWRDCYMFLLTLLLHCYCIVTLLPVTSCQAYRSTWVTHWSSLSRSVSCRPPCGSSCYTSANTSTVSPTSAHISVSSASCPRAYRHTRRRARYNLIEQYGSHLHTDLFAYSTIWYLVTYMQTDRQANRHDRHSAYDFVWPFISHLTNLQS